MGTTPNSNPTNTDTSAAPSAGAGFEVSPAQGGAQISFLKRGVQPPSNVYIIADDSLGVYIINSLAGQVLSVFGRILEPSGRIVPFEQDFTLAADSLLHVYTVGLAEGFLLDISAVAGNTATLRGQTYVAIVIGRKSGAAFLPLAPLCAAYVSQASIVGWPNAQIQPPQIGPGFTAIYNTTLPSGGATGSFTCPTGQSWKVLAAAVGWNTSGTTAPVYPGVILDPDVGGVLDFISPVALGAEPSVIATYWPGPPVEGATVLLGQVSVAMPEIRLLAGDTIRFALFSTLSVPAPASAQFFVEQLFNL